MKKKILVCLFLITLILLGIVLYLNQDKEYRGLKAYGNVDIRESSLAFEINGKINALFFDEGQKVTKGEILATLDTKALEHEKNIKLSSCKGLKAQLNLLENGYRKEEIDKAEAEVNALENEVKLQEKTFARTDNLYKKDAVSAQTHDSDFFKLNVLKEDLNTAKANLSLLKNGYRQEEIDAQKEAYQTCLNELDYIIYKIKEQSVIKAPYDGKIRTRNLELGDMASAQTPVFTLSQLNHKFVRCYLTELQLVKVKTGNKVLIETASGTTISGNIAVISDTAMFTPKTVQTEELRPQLVYEVRIDVADPDEVLRLGQSVSVIFE
ncbi:HlyD family efflux transporter periplasmic adaptor subunit [uncultured Succinatimonas sp.]|uniref:HlyD family efflux transporter periplasmic adaptor subunit n=1 Tax=uncultured Succinatimonas sp. TaxID=1262973 RepID=UPI0025EFD039|nr:HlyD family efflux transporter periplasmic adaptor subunit [uncultured Succinatimonas sp.]